jgi:hypothetical protein
MRAKSRFSFWLTAAAVLVVAAYACAPARAQSYGDFIRFNASHLRSDKIRKNSLDIVSLEGQRRKAHRRSDSSRAPPINAKSKPGKSARGVSKKAARSATVSVENVPLPLPRPPFWPEPHTFAEAAGPGFDTASVTSALSDCDQRLAEIADIELLPRLIGPGECGGRDMVRLNAVLLPNHKRVEVKPTAVLHCAMAESFAAWVRDEASDHVAARGDALRSVDTYGSYECRGRNWVADAKLSEHGKGNAIDVRALVLAGGRHIDLTDEPFQNRFAMICEIPLVIALRQCWDPALTATTITTSISTASNEITAPVFANGMCTSRRLRRLRWRAGVFGWPPGRHSLSPGRQRARPSLKAPGQSDPITRKTSCKAAP